VTPETHYTKCGTINIAYQVLGEGPLDILLVPGWITNLDILWEEPRLSRFLLRLASFSRLILFDKRGTGLSDRVTNTPTLEERMEDVRSVMAAVGSTEAALVGWSEGGPMCALFAATYPEMTRALVMIGSYPRRFKTEDYPIGPSKEENDAFIASIEDNWGTDFALAVRAPSLLEDSSFRAWWGRYLRMSASPSAAQALTQANSEIDIRDILPSIAVPTLLLHATGDMTLDVEHSRYMVTRIPGARLIEVDSDDHLPWLKGSNAILSNIEDFLTGSNRASVSNRMLCTLLFTDIVSSTEMLERLGDEGWSDLLSQHDEAVRRELTTFSGREIKTTGDGFLATFDGPARAIQCAKAVRQAAAKLGVNVRQGLHTGECEMQGNDLSGLAVHIAARISDLAGTGEILVSRTVRDLVAGSGLTFEGFGLHELKGIEDQWQLYRVT
jgi:class 3 adenylate cyclase